MPNETTLISRNLSRTAIWVVSGLGIAVFLIPLLFGGWSVPGWPGLPKAVSQFRNPLLVLVSVVLVLRPSLSKIDADRLVLPILGIYLVAFLKAAFLDYAGFVLNAIDFSMYDHAMANTLAGRFMEAISGVNHFGIHATPVLFLLLPLHALFHSPYFALFLQPVVLWLGAIALDRIATGDGIRGWARLATVFAYLNCVLVSQTLHYGLHVEVFYPLFGFLLFGAIRKRKILQIVGALLLFLSIKEDAPFYAVGILAAAAGTRKIQPKWAMLLGLFSIGVGTFYLRVLIPANSDLTNYKFVGAAAGFGDTPSAAIGGAIHHLGQVLKNLFHGGWWPLIVPSIGLLALSPFFWIASTPFFGIYSLAGSRLMLGLALYYGMPFVPLFFYGWLDGLKRETLPKRRVFSLAIATIGLSLFGSGYLVFRKADLARWRSFAPITEAIRVVEANPAKQGGKICAPGVLIPHMGYPKNLRLLTPECVKNAELIVLADPNSQVGSALSTYPLESAVYGEIFKETDSWPIVSASGEFSIRRRPGIEKF